MKADYSVIVVMSPGNIIINRALADPEIARAPGPVAILLINAHVRSYDRISGVLMPSYSFAHAVKLSPPHICAWNVCLELWLRPSPIPPPRKRLSLTLYPYEIPFISPRLLLLLQET